MAKPQFIQPSPAGIDREAFGHWLSGFTDGEGCFYLALKPRQPGHNKFLVPQAGWFISLRQDDEPILRQAQSFLGVGRISRHEWRAGSSLQARLTVKRWTDLVGVIIPHFLAYPLRAKKAVDFRIWRQAVLLGAEVASRGTPPLPTGRGSQAKWQPLERERFQLLHDQLRQQRRFVPPSHDL